MMAGSVISAKQSFSESDPRPEFSRKIVLDVAEKMIGVKRNDERYMFSFPRAWVLLGVESADGGSPEGNGRS